MSGWAGRTQVSGFRGVSEAEDTRAPQARVDRRQLTDIYNLDKLYIQLRGKAMAIALTSIRLDKRLADEAAEVLGAKSRTEAVHTALREIVALKRFKKLMSKYGGKLEFSGHDG